MIMKGSGIKMSTNIIKINNLTKKYRRFKKKEGIKGVLQAYLKGNMRKKQQLAG